MSVLGPDRSVDGCKIEQHPHTDDVRPPSGDSAKSFGFPEQTHIDSPGAPPTGGYHTKKSAGRYFHRYVFERRYGRTLFSSPTPLLSFTSKTNGWKKHSNFRTAPISLSIWKAAGKSNFLQMKSGRLISRKWPNFTRN